MGDDTAGMLGDDSSGESAGEQQWDDSDSNDEEETFFLDPEGRVPFAGNVSFDFRSAPNALAEALSPPEVLAQVVKDCQTVFSARAKKLEYSTGETFWIQANAAPRNCLERLALDIFKAHTAGARFNQETSGAEWWTQVIEDADDIGWHWDKDYGMEARGINVHPCLATVTYLSTNGGPTVVLEKKGPMACEDIEEVSGEAAKAWVSRPALGKHICFDGRYLHAAPADLALPPPTTGLDETPPLGGGGSKKRDKDGESKVVLPGSSVDGKAGSSNTTARRRRVTFLVNVWLNHTPRTAAPLPAPTTAELGPSNLVLRLSPSDFVPPTPLLVDETAAPTGSGDDGAMPGQGRRPVATKQRRFGPAKPEPERQEASVATGSVAAREGGETAAAAAAAVDMKWEFGEVGDEAEKHLRHEVLVPVPIALLHLPSPADSEGAAAGCASKDERRAGSGDEERVGRSFCVEYQGTRRPRVSRVDLGEEGSEDSGSSGEESEEEDEESGSSGEESEEEEEDEDEDEDEEDEDEEDKEEV